MEITKIKIEEMKIYYITPETIINTKFEISTTKNQILKNKEKNTIIEL